MKRTIGPRATALLFVLAGTARADAPCDAGLALADVDPSHGAAAIELCDASSNGSPGVVSASYGSADLATPLDQLGTDGALGVGVLASFGPNVLPLRGDRMLALSTGTARSPSDPGWQDPVGFDKHYTSAYPVGLPYEIPACPGVLAGQPNDSVALRLVLQVPSFAHSFSFAFDFHASDFPGFVCSPEDDWFFATLSPAPPSGANVVSDPAGNPMTVGSTALLSVCTAQSADGLVYPCPDGPGDLAGTGFEGHAATGWLRTSVPVTPDTEITLDLGVLDAGDGILDSTVLLDDFRWSAQSLAAPVTVPEPSALAGAWAVAVVLTLARGRRRARRPSA